MPTASFESTLAASTTPSPEGWRDPFATRIPVQITLTSEPGIGIWIGWSWNAPYESQRRFAMWFDDAKWELASVVDRLPPVLRHRLIDNCMMQSVGGHGLGPGWTHSNVFREVGGAEIHTLELNYQGELKYINYSMGGETDYFTLIQVGSAPFQINPVSSEMLSEDCRKAAEQVLGTFTVIDP